MKVVLQVLKEHQFFAKYSKGEFSLRSVEFLGHIIPIKGVEVYLTNTKAVKNWPRHLAPTDIRSFLGLDGYYIRFVDGYALIASPLTTLTKKSAK